MSLIFNFIKNKTQTQKEDDLIFEIVTKINSKGDPMEAKVGIPDKDVIFAVNLNTGRNLVIRNINVLLDQKMYIDFNQINGYYIYSNEKFVLNPENHIPGNSGSSFPYPVKRLYNIENNLNVLDNTKSVNTKESKYKIPYTFGIEYETSAGFIPSDLCLNSKMIPLKDGSIGGLEYTTGVMSFDQDIELLKTQLSLLKKYTLSNKECSLHIHFGGFPIDKNYLYIVNFLCQKFEPNLVKLSGKMCLNTSQYKKTGKDYSRSLGNYKNFDDLYKFVSDDTANFMGDLNQNHPKDPSKTQKWNINSRYSWVNFVNACFYKDAKTIEFRFLRPTLDYKKLIYWLYILSGILKCAEHIYDQFFKDNKNTANADVLNYMITTDILSMLSSLYNTDMLVVFNQLSKFMRFQEEKLGDCIGDNETLIDKFITIDLDEVIKKTPTVSASSFIKKSGIREYVAPKPAPKKATSSVDTDIEKILKDIFGE